MQMHRKSEGGGIAGSCHYTKLAAAIHRLLRPMGFWRTQSSTALLGQCQVV
jgi:hypothetical protein